MWFETGENIFQSIRQRIDVAQMDGGNTVARGARAVHGFTDRALGGTPADEQHAAFGRAIDFRQRQGSGEGLQFLAALGGHGHVQFRRAGGMAELVVFEAVAMGYLPSKMRVPGLTCGVTPSFAAKS